MKYLVAIDFSDIAYDAFEEGLKAINKEKDEIVVLSVVEHTKLWVGIIECNASLVEKAKKIEDKAIKKSLARCGARCRELGLNHTLVMWHGPHVGEAICTGCEKYNVDVLIVGRRGMSNTKRLLVGSTSRYCVDHAPCNVLVIKNPHESQPAGIKYHNNPPSPSILLFSLSHLSPFLLSHLLFTALISASLSMAPGDEGVLEAEMLTITEHRS